MMQAERSYLEQLKRYERMKQAHSYYAGKVSKYFTRSQMEKALSYTPERLESLNWDKILSRMKGSP